MSLHQTHALPPPQTIEYPRPATFVIQKTPPAVVLSDNAGKQVVFTTPAGLLIGLPNPDASTTEDWSTPLWTTDAAVDISLDSDTYDLVADSSDNLYLTLSNRNELAAYVYAFSAPDGSSNPPSAPANWPAGGRAKLGSNLRIFKLYSVSTLEVEGKIFVPTVPTLSNVGLAIVDESDGSVQDVSVDFTVNPPAGGSAAATGITWAPAAQAGSAMALIAHAGGVKNYAAAAYPTNPSCDINPVNGISEFCQPTFITQDVNGNGAKFVADINQPPPTLDPFTNNAYFLGIHGQAAQQDAPFLLYCVDTTSGQSCPGWSDKGKKLPALWGPDPP